MCSVYWESSGYSLCQRYILVFVDAIHLSHCSTVLIITVEVKRGAGWYWLQFGNLRESFYTFGYIQECFRFQMYWSKHLWSKITHMHKALLLGVFLLVVCTCTVDIYIYIHLYKLLNARLKNGFLQCWIMRDVRMEGELEFYEGL